MTVIDCREVRETPTANGVVMRLEGSATSWVYSEMAVSLDDAR